MNLEQEEIWEGFINLFEELMYKRILKRAQLNQMPSALEFEYILYRIKPKKL